MSTLVAVYLLVLVGSIVRSTGSGMGCPDWPKCFGSWLPPSSVKDLPDNYKEIYSRYRAKKNIKFASLLNTMGLKTTAEKLLNDKTIAREEDFSPLKSKIEYINRIVGVAVGFMISLVLLKGFKFFKTRPAIFIAAAVSWLSVVFTGWFGSIVVSTNLTPWTISVHLGFALLIIALLVFLFASTLEQETTHASGTGLVLWLSFIALIIQIIFGVQVREQLDQIMSAVSARSNWISNLGMEFIIHRSFSWAVVLLNALLTYKLIKNFGYNWRSTGVAALTLGSIISGVGMAYGSVPAFLQPLHLIFSALAFGILLLMIFRNKISDDEAIMG